MGYQDLKSCVRDLRNRGDLIDIQAQVDGHLELAAIHRKFQKEGGPALLFHNIRDCAFPVLTNLYGTWERTQYIFQKEIPQIKQLFKYRSDPSHLIKSPAKWISSGMTAMGALPKKVINPSVLYQQCSISDLPQIVSWPEDGGAFITLPQVISWPPEMRKIMKTNIGMYRIQLSGNAYQPNKEIGLHYQLHRGIGVHHKAYLDQQKSFKVAIGVGGPPGHTIASIFPLPEGLSETVLTGLLNGRRYRYSEYKDYLIPANCDFLILGEIVLNTEKSEGPFGDHLGYYSLEHPFPYMEVEEVWHRKDPIWHMTVVGRPPAEDSNFGKLIHTLVEDVTKDELPGIHELNAVDEAGVHPLLLAIGEERYMPFRGDRPEELLTQANLLLGKGQTSLAKYLFITDVDSNPNLSCAEVPAFIHHVLERVNFQRDVHFYTNWTIDTLDYSGSAWNAGSKMVLAAVGPAIRSLKLIEQDKIGNYTCANIAKGILAISYDNYTNDEDESDKMQALIRQIEAANMKHTALIVLTEDADFLAADYSNFIWVCFTRSNPAHDVYACNAVIQNKHWSADAPLIIDARMKPHMAPVLVEPEQCKDQAAHYWEQYANSLV